MITAIIIYAAIGFVLWAVSMVVAFSRDPVPVNAIGALAALIFLVAFWPLVVTGALIQMIRNPK